MLFTDVQRSVRLNKKKKSTNTSPYPDEVIDRLARAFYPAILACRNSEEGQRSLVGARPLHLANTRPFGRLKAPLGLSLLHCAAQTRACRVAGGAGSYLWQRKTGSSRRGTPCQPYRVDFCKVRPAGAHPVFVLSESTCGLFFWRIIRFNTQHPVADPHMGLNQMQRMCA